MKRLIVLQHLEIEGPGLFYQIAKERGMNIEIIRLDQGDGLPKTIKDDLLLIMGGPMGVKDIGLSLIHIPSPRDGLLSRMPSSA